MERNEERERRRGEEMGGERRGREGGEEGRGNIDLLFHLLMHSLADSCMYPAWGWNPQP